MCILLDIKGQNDNVDLKNIKLFRIIPKKKKKKFFNFFKKFGGAIYKNLCVWNQKIANEK